MGIRPFKITTVRANEIITCIFFLHNLTRYPTCLAGTVFQFKKQVDTKCLQALGDKYFVTGG